MTICVMVGEAHVFLFETLVQHAIYEPHTLLMFLPLQVCFYYKVFDDDFVFDDSTNFDFVEHFFHSF